MKINLKKALITTTIVSTSTAIMGLSIFIVGGYGNKISSLSEIENSGYFGLNTAFVKEKTNEVDTKDKYVKYLTLELQSEADKKNGVEYNESINKIKESESTLENYMITEVAPLEEAVKIAQVNFDKNRSNSNKELLRIAEQNLSIAMNNKIISDNNKIISDNNKIINKINQSEEDIPMLNNYFLWNTLFIIGTVLLSVGSIIAVVSTSYSIYLKKNTKEI